MAHVITVSRYFMQGHPKAGQPTFFVEKILKSLYPNADYYICKCEQCGWAGYSNCLAGGGQIADTGDYGDALCPKCGSSHLDGEIDEVHDIGYYRQNVEPKQHTIRGGKRWKTGDKASLRVWSGKPYRSGQIVLAPDVTLIVKDIEIYGEFGFIRIDGKEGINPDALALNDGLSVNDLADWFQRKPFSGQLLIWNNNKLPY